MIGVAASHVGISQRYVRRALVVWVGLRVATAVGGDPNPGMLEELVVVTVVTLTVFLDAVRRREDLFLANLGISRPAM